MFFLHFPAYQPRRRAARLRGSRTACFQCSLSRHFTGFSRERARAVESSEDENGRSHSLSHGASLLSPPRCTNRTSSQQQQQEFNLSIWQRFVLNTLLSFYVHYTPLQTFKSTSGKCRKLCMTFFTHSPIVDLCRQMHSLLLPAVSHGKFFSA